MSVDVVYAYKCLLFLVLFKAMATVIIIAKRKWIKNTRKIKKKKTQENNQKKVR